MKSYTIPLVRLEMIRECDSTELVRITDSKTLHQYLAPYFQRHDREEMVALLLDAKHGVIGLYQISVGSLTLSIVHPREVFKAACAGNAAALILAHNHPSGDPTPSREDRELTTRLVAGGKLLGIPILDHIIIGDTRYTSFADEGWL